MKYMIIGLFLLFAGNIYAQVRGTVKDSTGEAIPGANVFWMNTGQGVTTCLLYTSPSPRDTR